MGTYVPKTVLLPAGLDEVALDRSLVRLPTESLFDFKRRLLLEHRDPVTNSFDTFKKSPTRQVGLMEKPIARLNLNVELERPRLRITSTKLYWWSDFNEEPDLVLDLVSRKEAYFLTNVMDALVTLGVFTIDILDPNFTYRFSRHLRVDDTRVTTSLLLGENYVNNVQQTLISNLRFSDPLVFKNEVSTSGDVAETGDFYVDYENGVIFSNDLQHGYVNFDYAAFPFILWWQPVRVFELNDPDVNILVKDLSNTDVGAEHLDLNWRGAKYLNELSKVYPLEWGE
jgi:hypothetical protein